MKRLFQILILVLVCSATVHPIHAQGAPGPEAVSVPGPSGPGIDIDPDRVGAWLSVLLLMFGFWKSYQQKRNLDKWTKIKELVPEAHAITQKVAALTKTKKDDYFVSVLGQLLEALGFVLTPADEKAAKMLGEGYHQEYKMERSAVDAAMAQAEVAARTAVESGTIPAAPASAEGN